MLKPDYLNCILNIVSSLKKYYNQDYVYPTNDIVDEELSSKPKHIILMILDGMGSVIIDKHQKRLPILVENKKTNISSVYPSTTSASIPACVSGKAPVETCWVGWENYVPEVDRDVVFFKNTDFITNEKLDFDIKTIFPYEPFYKDLGIEYHDVGPYFYKDGCKNFKEFTNKLSQITKKDNPTFTYAYWDNPDGVMHVEGTDSKGVKKIMKNINKHLTKFTKNMKDTCLIITADHGHIDCEPIYIKQYKELYGMLKRMPSNEARCAFFNVKEEYYTKFEETFNKLFKDKFILNKKDEFLDNEFLGLDKYSIRHKRINELLGDYIAIGIDKYYFNCLDDGPSDFIFKSHHAGLTYDEITVPLIIINK